MSRSASKVKSKKKNKTVKAQVTARPRIKIILSDGKNKEEWDLGEVLYKIIGKLIELENRTTYAISLDEKGIKYE